MSAPFEKFILIKEKAPANYTRYMVQIGPAVVHRTDEKQFIEDAIREKLEREQTGAGKP